MKYKCSPSIIFFILKQYWDLNLLDSWANLTEQGNTQKQKRKLVASRNNSLTTAKAKMRKTIAKVMTSQKILYRIVFFFFNIVGKPTQRTYKIKQDKVRWARRCKMLQSWIYVNKLGITCYDVLLIKWKQQEY